MRRIEDWSRTRWIIFSLVLGVVLSYARLSLGPPDPTQTSTLGKFEAKLLREPVVDADKREYAWAKDVYLYAPEDVPSPEGTGEKRKLTLVTFRLLEVQNGEFVYQPGAVRIQEPMDLSNSPLQSADGTARSYLEAASHRMGRPVYHYVWWLEPRWVYPLWSGISLLLVGIAWPIVLDRLIAAGFGRRSDSLPPSLWQRWRQAQADAARRRRSAANDPMLAKQQAANTKGLSSEEMARLEAMEEGLRGFTGAAAASPDDSGAPIEAPVRQLGAGPLQSQPQPEAKKDDKDYGGEFYPTVAHAKRKADE